MKTARVHVVKASAVAKAAAAKVVKNAPVVEQSVLVPVAPTKLRRKLQRHRHAVVVQTVIAKTANVPVMQPLANAVARIAAAMAVKHAHAAKQPRQTHKS